MITAFGKAGSDNSSHLVAAVKAMSDSQSRIQRIADQEISTKAMTFANKLRQFQSTYKQMDSNLMNGPYSQPSATNDQRSVDWSRRIQANEQLRTQHVYEFNVNFKGEAIYLRDELV